MNAAASPSGLLHPTDTVELTCTQRARLMDRLRRRDRIVKAIGAGLLALSGFLAWQLIQQPVGTIANLPGCWRGTPLVLGATFCGILGGLVLVLRRFSLGALLVATCTAGFAAFSTQAFLRTIQDSEALQLEYSAPQPSRIALAQRLGEAVTEVRLQDLLADLKRDGLLEEPFAFDAVLVSTGNTSGSGVELTARFVFCPYFHERQSSGRYVAMHYAALLADLAAEETPEASRSNGQRHAQAQFLTLSTYLSRRYTGHFKTTIDAARWLAERERHPETRHALERFLEQSIR